MKVELEDIQSCVKKISVEVPLEKVNEEKSAVYDEMAKEVNIPGFRKGKVPRKMLEKRFGKSALQNAGQRIIESSYKEAIESNNLRPIGDPMIDDIKIEENEPVSFTATVETFPEVEVEKIDGVKFQRKIKKVSDEEMGRIIDNARERQARFEPVEDRAAQEGDYPLIDYTATRDNEKIEVLSGDNKQVHIKKGDMLEEVQANVIGMRKGEEKKFEAVLPKEFPDPQLAGEKVEFKVKVNEIKKKTLPEVDDDFVKEISEFDTLDQFKADLRSQLEKRNESMAQNDLREEILTYLIEKNSFDLPPRLVQKHAKDLAKRAQQRFESQGIDMGESDFDTDKFKEKFLEDAIRDLKEQALVASFGKAEKMEVSEEELKKEIESLSKMMGQTVDQTTQQLAQSNGLEGIYQKLFSEKAYGLMMDKLIIEDSYVEEPNEK
ncbi:Cell division trigger factor [hydrothermal vent metagenome]|uniref:peptidylprolyl isomerase n=1 Tax=hydrothermal vent metagenome TaxID=652676 RepID=A0A3B1C0H2_9ZZZZ